MHLDHHLAQVHDQLGAAAALGDDRTREVAAALATAATPVVRLAIISALTEAADEITAALLDYPGAPDVSVRLEGEEVSVDVRAMAPVDDPPDARRDDGDTSARISLRLSEALKTDIDAAAESEGVSVNTWLVRAASAALRPAPFSATFGPNVQTGRGRRRQDTQQRITGWING
jgi:uncharacterized protein (DUF1778 family)